MKDTTPSVLHFDNTLPLIAYREKEKESEKKVNLFDQTVLSTPSDSTSSESDEATKEKTTAVSKVVEDEDGVTQYEETEEPYLPYLKQELNLHLVYEHAKYKSRAELIP